ncbi:MAG: hypothetical protein L0J45_05180 [Psychroflexus sp.]|nr:hypothetical protein [Psychroflexus sp.]MDN6309758.1 hypothetical protein [Psychroflexus sp.]
MAHEIEKHYDDEDIQRINLDRDIKLWKTEINFLVEELDFYVHFLNAKLIKQNTADELNDLHNKVKELAMITKEYSGKIIEFDHEAEGIIECDDLSCEVFFLNAHLRMKDELNAHLAVSRQLKTAIFEKLSKHISA